MIWSQTSHPGFRRGARGLPGKKFLGSVRQAIDESVWVEYRHTLSQLEKTVGYFSGLERFSGDQYEEMIIYR